MDANSAKKVRFRIEKLEERIAPAPTGVVTPADTIHPNIHTKVGQGDGTNANPNGANDGGGNIHGIANVPGKGGGTPQSGGFAQNLTTVHGGIDAYNPNA